MTGVAPSYRLHSRLLAKGKERQALSQTAKGPFPAHKDGPRTNTAVRHRRAGLDDHFGRVVGVQPVVTVGDGVGAPLARQVLISRLFSGQL